jgi:hypothetical protein
VCYTDHDTPRLFISQKRWDKLQGHLEWLEARTLEGVIPRKHFLSVRGYLVFVSMTYRSIEPYMKGLHLTAEAWRPTRDADGWRTDSQDPRLILLDEDSGEYLLEGDLLDDGDPPSSLTPVPRLLRDVKAIRVILKGPTPVMRILRPRISVRVFYGFGDASGSGYGKALRGACRQSRRIDFEYVRVLVFRDY